MWGSFSGTCLRAQWLRSNQREGHGERRSSAQCRRSPLACQMRRVPQRAGRTKQMAPFTRPVVTLTLRGDYLRCAAQRAEQVLANAFEPRGACPVRVLHHGVATDGPRSMHRAARTWRGCSAGQRAARSSPRRRPRCDRPNTAIGRQKRIRMVWSTRSKPVARVPHAYRTMK